MIRTKPIPIGFLTDYKFRLGRRVSGLLQEPFDKEALQKRPLRKSKDKSKAEMAYYIDTRALSQRLDQVLGPANWNTTINIVKDLGDRICVVAELSLGNTVRQAEGEELKQAENFRDGTMKTQELVFMKAGPQARKRAAVEYGISAYLYNFSEVNTWEEIDSFGQPKDPNIDYNKLPDWAKPTPGPILVTRELAYLLNINLPADLSTALKQNIQTMQEFLNKYFGITTLSAGLAREDYLELASLIARISDHLDAEGGTLEALLQPLVDSQSKTFVSQPSLVGQPQ